MSDETSVRPENLESFVSGSKAIEQHLIERINSLGATYRAFQASSGVTVANGALFASSIPGLIERLEGTRTFTELVRSAVLSADVAAVGGVVTLSSVQFDAALAAAAHRAGVDLDSLTGPQKPVEVVPPTVGTVPQSSGYVDDPVCTATGHFLEDELDLAMPDRVGHLAWRRRYSSRQLDVGAHGRGWWSWAEARCARTDEGVLLVAPDGRHITFGMLDGEGAVGTTDGADVTVRSDGPGLVVEWGPRAADGPETWWFDADGRPLRAVGPVRGTTTFEHAGGRLVALRHEGGRHLRLEWDGERIVAAVAEDGRRATYRYDSQGDLVAVERASGGRTYAPDEHGRIVEVVDADGVVLCVNRFDEEGRVVRQIAPTGRVTLFRYEPGRRTSVLDGQGELVALYVHDRLGRVETMVTPGGASLVRRFDADGVVVEQHAHDGTSFVSEGSAGPDGTLRVIHGDGRTETFRYDHLGRLVEHQRGDDEPLRIAYQGDSQLPARLDGPLGWSLAVEWADGGVLRSVTDADGVAASFEADPDGMVVAVADGRGRRSRITRHAAGPATRVDLPDGGAVEATIDDAGRPTRVVDPTGRALALSYSAAGRLTGIDDGGARTELRYGADGTLESTTGPHGDWSVATDGWGRPVALTDTTGASWQIGYDDLGGVASLTTPTGAAWQRHLDDHHRPSGVTDPAGRRTEVTYDDAGWRRGMVGPLVSSLLERDPQSRVLTRTSTPGGRSTTVLDECDRVVEVTDADGAGAHYGWTPGGRLASIDGGLAAFDLDYDDAGQLAAVRRRADGRAWRYERDWRGAEVEITSPEGRTTRVERDLVGRPLAIEQAGAAHRFDYDDAGNVAAATAPTGATSRFVHDAAGRLVAVEDPSGARTTFAYDAGGRLAAETDALGATTAYEHDADGRLVARTDALGRTTRYLHDTSGVPTGTDLADGTALRFDLDPSSRVDAVRQDDVELARYGYGADGLLSRIEEPGRSRREHFRYSDAGRVVAWGPDDAGVEVTREGGLVVERRGPGLPEARWRHHADGMEGELDGRAVRLEADADGATRLIGVGDAELVVDRDDAGRVRHLDLRTADGVGGQLRLERDLAGRVAAVAARDLGPGVDGDVRYGYDDADRLTLVDGPSGRVTFHYDLAGRLIEERRPEGSRRFAYDIAHQLVEVAEPDGTTVRYEYDACGRRVAEHRDGRTRRFEWDALGRLTAVVDDDHRLDVDIDAMGLLRRVGDSEVRWDHSGPVPVPATVDGRALLTIGRRIVADGDRILPGGLLGGAGEQPWGHADASPTVQTDVGLPGGLGFAGLIWLGARIYDPATRQFLTPDPLPGVPGASVLGFRYHYAGQDPVNHWDPTGLAGRPISVDDFNDMRDKATSVQWSNIATAGLAVVGAVAMGALMLSGVGLVGLVVAGAAIGGVSAAVPAAIEGKSAGEVARQFGIGALVGGATTLVGGALFHGAPTTLLAGMGRGAQEGLVTGVPAAFAQEGLDSYAGGDGRFDLDKAATGAVMNTVGSTITGGIATRRPTIPDLPPTVDPVPSPLHVVDSVPEGWVTTPSGIAHPSTTLITPTPGLSLPQPGIQVPAPPTGWVESPSGLLIPGG